MPQSGIIGGLSFDDLNLAATLASGQVFRWQWDAADGGSWRGMVNTRRVRLAQSETGDRVFWEADGSDAADASEAVRSFLRLSDANLPSLAHAWGQADPLFADAWQKQPGVRLLRQAPDECFFSFLCASVAPIARISGMLHAVAGRWGTPADETGFYTVFPSAQHLEQASETELRTLGLGFRAKRVARAAGVLSLLPADHLAALRYQATYAEAKQELTAFFGVGEKIADCVCLFSLDKNGAVPVDVHIWRIVQTRYAPDLAGKPLTPAHYTRAVQAFHDRFGPYAGWAQQILFYRAAVGRQKP